MCNSKSISLIIEQREDYFDWLLPCTPRSKWSAGQDNGRDTDQRLVIRIMAIRMGAWQGIVAETADLAPSHHQI